MIAEAIDTVLTLGWALAAWIAVLSAGVTLVLLGAAGAVWWALRAIRRTARTLAGSRKALSASQGDEVPPSAPRLPRPSERRSTPSWAIPGREPAESRNHSEAA